MTWTALLVGGHRDGGKFTISGPTPVLRIPEGEYRRGPLAATVPHPVTYMWSSDDDPNMVSRPNKTPGQPLEAARQDTGEDRSGATEHRIRIAGLPASRDRLDAPLSAENDPRRAKGVRPAQIRQEPPRTDTATHGGAGGSAGLRAPGTHRRTPSGNRHTHSVTTPEPSCRGMAYRPSKRPKDEAAQ